MMKAKEIQGLLLGMFLVLLSLSPLYTEEVESPRPVLPEETDFRSPLDIELDLAGGFGEIRTNHFHAGLDIRTQSKTGWPVHAIGDGFVSRVVVSPYGYGKAVYIDHPNGYTSVYAHLDKFKDALTETVIRRMEKEKICKADLIFEPNELIVKKGDVIAWSGNSGSSNGPHLHFEVRETFTERPVNPFKFGIAVKDDVAPEIKGITFYGLNSRSGISHSNSTIGQQKTSLPVIRSGRKYMLNNREKLKVQGKIGIGFTADDRFRYKGFTIGLYEVVLKVDGEARYIFKNERFSFDETRYVNAHIDYEEKLKSSKIIQRAFLLPGNRLSMYNDLVNNGIIEFSDQETHTIELEIKDFDGNSSKIAFEVQNTDQLVVTRDNKLYENMFIFSEKNEFKNEDVHLLIPAYSLYQSESFKYDEKEGTSDKMYSPLYQIHNKYTPVHTEFTLKIKPKQVPPKYIDKAFIVLIDRRGYHKALETKYEDGYLISGSKEFGDFYISVDTVAPSVSSVNVSQGSNLRGVGKIKFKVKDNHSGIEQYYGFIDGKYIVFDYDYKTHIIEHELDKNLSAGKHKLQVEVTDLSGNKKVLAYNFTR